MMDAAQLAVLIGIANGAVLLLKPIARLHMRIDTLERDNRRIEADLDGFIKAVGIPPEHHG